MTVGGIHGGARISVWDVDSQPQSVGNSGDHYGLARAALRILQRPCSVNAARVLRGCRADA